MFWPRRSILAAFVAGLCALAPLGPRGAAADDSPARAPSTYEGRSAEWWVEEYVSGSASPNSLGHASNALAALGDEATLRLGEVVLGSDPDRRGRASGFLYCSLRPPLALLDILQERLHAADPAVRIAAAEALGNLGRHASRALPDLTLALRDPDPGVRIAVARALSGLRQRAAPAVPDLVTALDDSESMVRVYALDSLRWVGPAAKDAVPALLARLGRGEQWLDRSILGLLGAIGPSGLEAVEALRRFRRSEDPFTRAAAVRSLASCLGADAAAVDSTESLDDADLLVRQNAISALAAAVQSPEVALPPLIRALEDPEPTIRSGGQEGIRNFRERAADAVPALIRSIRTYGLGSQVLTLGYLPRAAAEPLAEAYPTLPVDVRAEIAATSYGFLGEGSDGAVRRFISALSADLLDPQLPVEHRRKVASALGRVAPRRNEAVIALAWSAGSPDVSVREVGLAALLAAVGRRETFDLLLASPDATSRRAVLVALQAQVAGCIVTEPRLSALLSDVDDDVRRLAAFVLLSRQALRPAGSAHRGASLPYSVRTLHDAVRPGLASDDAGTRATAARCLGLLPEASIDELPALLEFLTDAEARVAKASAIALASIARVANLSVLELVRPVLDGDPPGRLAAALALAEAGGYHVVVIPVVLPALSDAAPAARLAACEAAAALGPDGKALTERIEVLVHDADPAVAKAAADALGKLRPESNGRKVAR